MQETKIYQSKKLVIARPMTRGEYNLYRGWAIPDNECPDDEGCLLEDFNNELPNDTRHKGYITWLPTKVLESNYDLVGIKQTTATETDL